MSNPIFPSTRILTFLAETYTSHYIEKLLIEIVFFKSADKSTCSYETKNIQKKTFLMIWNVVVLLLLQLMKRAMWLVKLKIQNQSFRSLWTGFFLKLSLDLLHILKTLKILIGTDHCFLQVMLQIKAQIVYRTVSHWEVAEATEYFGMRHSWSLWLWFTRSCIQR